MSQITLDFSALEITPPVPKISGSLKYTPDAVRIDYYSADGLDYDARGRCLGRFIKSIKIFENDDDQVGSWIWSIIDMTFPGLSKILIDSTNTYKANALKLSVDEIRILTTDSTPIIDPTTALKADRVLFSLATALTAAGYDEPTFNDALPVVASLIFAIGKKPNKENLDAFNKRRIAAYFNKLNTQAESTAWISNPDNLPTVGAYQTFHTYFVNKFKLREVTTTMFISWTVSADTTPEQEAVATTVKLWKDHGFVHVMIIRGLLVKYGEVIEDIRPLRAETLEFISMYRAFSTSKDAMIRFDRVIRGDRSAVMPSKSFPELFKLARHVAELSEATFANYASNIGESVYWDIFVSRCVALDIPDFTA